MRIVAPVIAISIWAVLSAAQAAEPYPIDVILSLTGPGAFLAHGEQDALVVAEHAIDDEGGISGRPVKFVYHDDESNPQTAVQLATQVVAGKPAVVLGSSLVASCRAFAPLLQSGPVDYCFSPGFHPDPSSYVFSSSISTLDLMDVQVRYFRLKGWKRLAFLVSTDATGQDAESGIKQTFAKPENKDMQLVELAHFSVGDVSAAAQIETIKAAKPQCVIAWATGTPIATIFRAMVDAGLDLPTATTGGNMTYRQMEQYVGFLPRRLYFASPQWIVRDHVHLKPIEFAAHDEFYKYFEGALKKPDASSPLSWDPAMILTAALRKLGPGASAEQLHDYLVHLKDFAGANGVYDFEAVPQRGLSGDAAVVTVWSPKAQTWEVVSKAGGAPLD
jgi:branched-chain amino acid transport system substrate-binding protein